MTENSLGSWPASPSPTPPHPHQGGRSSSASAMAKSPQSGAATIWTIGHSTRPIEEFLDLLQTYRVETIADLQLSRLAHQCLTIVRRDLGDGLGVSRSSFAEDETWPLSHGNRRANSFLTTS